MTHVNKYIVKQENDYDGLWYMVYVNGQPITGFRDFMDANIYVTWCTNPNTSNKNERPQSVCESGNQPK